MSVVQSKDQGILSYIYIPKLSYSKNGTSFKDRNTKKKGNKAKL